MKEKEILHSVMSVFECICTPDNEACLRCMAEKKLQEIERKEDYDDIDREHYCDTIGG